MKRIVLIFFKIVLPLAIVGWLLNKATQDDSFSRLWNDPKDWTRLGCAVVLTFAAVFVTFLRWYLLVRALDLPFRIADAFRLGFLGYLFSFIALGNVSGDLFKAVFIAREQPGRKGAAVSSVIVDRLIGLYALFLVVFAAFCFTDVGQAAKNSDQFRPAYYGVLICTIIGGVAGLVFLIPALTDGAWAKKIESIPKVGRFIESIHNAIRMYRSRQKVLWLALFISIIVHCSMATTYYLIATGLPGQAPSYASHFIIAPLSTLVAILPVMMNGLGVQETATKAIYASIPSDVAVTPGLGLLVSLTYRVMTLLVAGIGAIYYLSRRREVAIVMHDVEESLEPHESAEAAVRDDEKDGNSVAILKSA